MKTVLRACLSFSLYVLPFLINGQPTVDGTPNQISGKMGSENILPYDLAFDNSNNMYVLGSYDLAMRSPINLFNSTFSPYNSYAYYLIKYTSGGAFEWGIRLNGQYDIPRQIKTDNSGNVYYAGETLGGVPTSQEIWFGKNNGGIGVWGHTIGGSGADVAKSVTVDNSGNVYITGSYTGSSVDFDPGPGTAFLGSGGSFVAIYDTNGAYLRGFTLPASVTISKITLDNAGNIVMMGTFYGSVDFDPGAGVQTRTVGPLFIAKYSNQGDFIWVDQISSVSSYVTPMDITTDTFNNVILTGSIGGNTAIDFDPGPGIVNLTNEGSSNIFLAKYDQNGAYQFAFKLGSSGSSVGLSVKSDNAGNIYCSGSYTATVDFDPGPGIQNVNPVYFQIYPQPSQFLSKYNIDGSLQWVSGVLIGSPHSNVGVDNYQNLIWQRATYNADLSTGIALITKYTQPVNVSSMSLTEGPVSTTITLTGTNFSTIASKNTVKFNGVQATVISSSLSTITTTVPAGATTGSITVTVDNVTGTSTSNFTVTVPAITSASSGTYGGTINLTTKTGGSTGAVTYSVTNGTGSATVSGSTLNLTGAGTVTVTANIAADANYFATSAQQTVTINKANQTISFPTLPTKTCSDAAFTLPASASSGLPISYTSSNASVATIAGNTVTITGVGNTIITASETGNNNFLAASEVSNVLAVNPMPSPVITASGPTSFCQGSSVTLTASSGNSYLWSNGATSQSISVNSSGNYSVTVTTSAGCSSTSAPISTVVNPVPSTPTIAGPSSSLLCGSTTLTSSAASSYQWSNGATTQTITVTTGGNYTVTTGANGCTATSAPFTLNDGRPKLRMTAGSTDFCGGSTATLQGPYGSSFLWSNGATTQSITVSTSGSYSVTVTNPYYESYLTAAESSSGRTEIAVPPACSGTLTSAMIIIAAKSCQNLSLMAATEEEEKQEYTLVYPNPSHEEAYVVIPKPALTREPINIFDLHGKVIFESHFEKGEYSKTIYTRDIAEGMYLVRIGTSTNKKLVIVH